MNRTEARRYLAAVRRVLPPVPAGLEAADIAGRGAIGEKARRIRRKHAPYNKAIEVFRRAGEIHRDNLSVRDSGGKPMSERFAHNAFDYISGLIEQPGVSATSYSSGDTYTSVYTADTIDHYDLRFIAPSSAKGNQILVVDSWNPHRDADGNWAPLLLESYLLVKGEGIHSRQVPTFKAHHPPEPPIKAWAESIDPEGEMDISHIAAFLYQQTTKNQP